MTHTSIPISYDAASDSLSIQLSSRGGTRTVLIPRTVLGLHALTYILRDRAGVQELYNITIGTSSAPTQRQINEMIAAMKRNEVPKTVQGINIDFDIDLGD